MAQHEEETTSKVAADETRKPASRTANKANESLKSNRGQDGGKERLAAAADYVREHDARAMADDAIHTARQYPLASLFIAGAVVVGGGLVVARLLHSNSGPEGPRGQSLYETMSQGWGPKTTETVTRLRDAVFSVALFKAVVALEDALPGFREHFDKA